MKHKKNPLASRGHGGGVIQARTLGKPRRTHLDPGWVKGAGLGSNLVGSPRDRGRGAAIGDAVLGSLRKVKAKVQQQQQQEKTQHQTPAAGGLLSGIATRVRRVFGRRGQQGQRGA